MTAKRMTKLETIRALLVRSKGATIEELVAATGWQKHSITARFAAFRRAGLEVTKGQERRGLVYHGHWARVAGSTPPPPARSSLGRALAFLAHVGKRLAG